MARPPSVGGVGRGAGAPRVPPRAHRGSGADAVGLEALRVPEPGTVPRRHHHDVRPPPVRRVGAASAHRLPLADGPVVLVLRGDRRPRLARPSALGGHPARRRRTRGALGVAAPRARAHRRPRRGDRLPALPVHPPLRVADLDPAPPVRGSRVDRRPHGAGGAARPVAVRGGRIARGAHRRRRERHGVGDDHPGTGAVARPRGLAPIDHLAARARHGGEGRRALDRRVAVVDRDADDPGQTRRRRARLLRVARIGVVHVDVDGGPARSRILVVLHPRCVRRHDHGIAGLHGVHSGDRVRGRSPRGGAERPGVHDVAAPPLRRVADRFRPGARRRRPPDRRSVAAHVAARR